MKRPPGNHSFTSVRIKKLLTILMIALLGQRPAAGQTRLLTGIVIDSSTHLPLAGVSVSLPATRKGGMT